MALDFAGLKAAVVAISPAQVSDDEAASAVNVAYQTLLSSRPGGGPWFGLKGNSTFASVPDKTTGTIALVNGSSEVNGVGTTFDQQDVGRYLLVGGRVPLRIATVITPTQLLLQQAWGEGPITGSPFQIATLRYRLPPDADRVTRMKGPTWVVSRRTLDLFDIWDPIRQQRGQPLFYAEAELISANSATAMLPQVLQGTAMVGAGASSVIVTLAAGTSGYQVSVSPSWNTSYAIRAGRTATEFTVDFGVAAPAGGSIDWLAVVPGAQQGQALIQTVLEFELLPNPQVAVTFAVEYLKRVADLASATDVPVLSPQYVLHASRVEMCQRLAARTGDQAWTARSAFDASQSEKVLQALIREDRRMRGASPIVGDSDDLADPFSAAWWQQFRVFNALAGGRLA